MTKAQTKRRQEATPRTTARQQAIKQAHALRTLQSIGYVITQTSPYAFFIERRVG